MSDLPEKATGVLEMMASTSTQIDVFSDEIIRSVKDGEADSLKVLVQLKAFDKCSERIQKEIEENYMTAADKYPGTSFEFMGNKIEKAELGTKYDYASCNDPIYAKLQKEVEDLDSRVKKREAFLKAIDTHFSLLDEETGEVCIIYPPKKKSTSGLKITIK